MLMKRTLEALGIESGRVKLVWASAAEGVYLPPKLIIRQRSRELGPLNWKAHASANGAALKVEEVARMSKANGNPNLRCIGLHPVAVVKSLS